jgi:zinc transport system ATP-binding protein
MSAAVSLEHVTFSYDHHVVLNDITADIPTGSMTSVIGPNGSGKTTLLRVMLGLEQPQDGFVHIFGEHPRHARHRIGYVPQHLQFDRSFPITVTEFLQFSAPELSARAVHEHLSHLGAGSLASAVLGNLSGGQLQRVLIARATIREPELLFLDEPASGVDVSGERTFYELIAHLHTQHSVTVVLISHEVDIVRRISDHVICLNHSVICAGDPTEVLTPTHLETLYGNPVTLHS